MSFNDEIKKASLVPMPYCELNFKNAGSKYYAAGTYRFDFPPYHVPAKVISFGSIRRALHKYLSFVEGSDVTTVFSDVDSEFSKLLASDKLKNRSIDYYLYYKGGASTDFIKTFSGRVDSYEFKDRKFIVLSKDKLGRLPEYPNYKIIKNEDFPKAYPDVIGRIMPIVYGNHIRYAENGEAAKFSGALPTLLVDITEGSYKFLVAGHHIKRIVDVFTIGADGVKDISYYNFWVSTSDDIIKLYPQGSINGIECAYVEFSELPVDSQGNLEEVYVNVEGFNNTDSDDYPVFENPVKVISNFLTTWVDASIQFDPGTWNEVSDECDYRGYKVKWYINERKSTLSLLNEILRTFGIKLYTKYNSSDNDFVIYFHLFHPSKDSNLEKFDEKHDILKGSFEIDFISDIEGAESNQIVNKSKYYWDYNWRFHGYEKSDEFDDSTSQSDYGELSLDIPMQAMIDDIVSAESVVQRISKPVADPVAHASFETSLKGLTVDIGDQIYITHKGGIASDGNGWNDRRCLVVEHIYDVSNQKVFIRARDINEICEKGFKLGDSATQASNWSSATDSDKEYGYLCDEINNQFADGTEGKVFA